MTKYIEKIPYTKLTIQFYCGKFYSIYVQYRYPAGEDLMLIID
ncbi:hypothetical protein [Clostridium sp. UBA871]